jgi:Uma2 family endonuclease
MATARKSTGAHTRRWSKQEYHRLGELGFFRGQRVELLEGHIVVLSPQKPEHSFTVDRAARALDGHFGQAYWVRMQLPLDLGEPSEPEPDVSVVIGPASQYRTSHPTGAVLIVEVSDTTLSYDRRRKGSLYARAGIADYWIVNLVRRQVEVYRDPIPDSSQRYGFRYASRTYRLPGAGITPLALPQVVVGVAELLA